MVLSSFSGVLTFVVDCSSRWSPITESSHAGSFQSEASERFLEIRPLFRHDRSLNRADLHADATVDADIKVDPVVISSLFVFPGTLVDACDRACINAVGDAFADVRDDGVWHLL